MAYVNPPDSLHLLMAMLKPMLSCETRYFEDGQQDEALRWVGAI